MILCCGDALIDMIPATTAQATPGFTPLPGGAVFNTAISLGRLGIPVEMLTGMSQDLFGAQLTRTLTDSNVGTRFNIVNTRPTTLAFVELTDGHATYTFYDENSAGRMITPTDLPDLTPDITTLYFGGISLCNTPAADTYLALPQQDRFRLDTYTIEAWIQPAADSAAMDGDEANIVARSVEAGRHQYRLYLKDTEAGAGVTLQLVGEYNIELQDRDQRQFRRHRHRR